MVSAKIVICSVLLSLVVLTTAEVIDYDPKIIKLIGRWYTVDMVHRPSVEVNSICLQMDINIGSSDTTVIISTSSGRGLARTAEQWTAKLIDSTLWPISADDSKTFEILDNKNKNEMVLQNKQTSMFLLMHRQPTSVSNDLYNKYVTDIAKKNGLAHTIVEQGEC